MHRKIAVGWAATALTAASTTWLSCISHHALQLCQYKYNLKHI